MKLPPPFRSAYSVITVLILLTVSLFLYQKPYYNWDMFPYMALAIDASDVSFETVHARIYEDASLSMSLADFNAISARQPLLRKDANAFHEILRYYEIKPGYNVIVTFFHTLGFSLVTSTYLPSIIGYFIIGCIMLAWLQRMIPSPFSQLATLALMASPFLITTARFSSPDMLCAALSFAGIFLIVEFSVVYGLILLAVAITARPDTVILFALVCAVLYKANKLDIKLAALFLLLGVITASVVVRSSELIKEYLFTTADYSPSWNTVEMVNNYGTSLQNGFASVFSSQIILFTILAGITLYLLKQSGHKLLNDSWALLVIASIASIIVHYLLHPVIEDRILIVGYLVILMGFCKSLSNFFSTLQKD